MLTLVERLFKNCGTNLVYIIHKITIDNRKIMRNTLTPTAEREQLQQYFHNVRQHTESLCKPLRPEDYVPQPVEYISPPKWHLAHTSWFFEQFILSEYKTSYSPYNDEYAFLFNSYYNHVGKRLLRANRGNLTRPETSDIYNYRAYIDQEINALIESTKDFEKIEKLVTLGLHHEQQHQELLLTDLKYILGHNPTFPVYRENFSLVEQKNSDFGFISIDGGIYEIGFEGDGFSYDNESGKHKCYLTPFEISKSLVTNKEYIEFIEDGGYQNFKFWLDEGWHWIQKNHIQSPLYWHQIDNEWHHYTLNGLKRVQDNCILSHISFYEAAAFAAWKGMRLPTEFEWEAVSSQLNWGRRWEWTNSAYLPYPGFKIADGAIGEYNGKFMINQMVLRGASTATSENHSRPTYRNFFHPHLQWQVTGIRLAR